MFAAIQVIAAAAPIAQEPKVLRICTDPDNLPFSNQAQEGFDNKIATLLARDLGRKPEFVSLTSREASDDCDVRMGVPTESRDTAVTNPYYRSTYVLVTRKGASPTFTSLNDDRLASMHIGVPVVGSGYAPPALVLTHRGLSANITGFRLRDQRRMIEAVLRGEIDAAIVWGPPGSYFAAGSEYAVAPVQPPQFQGIPFTYEISIGIIDPGSGLRDQVNASIARQCGAIQRILDEYRVPQVREEKPRCEPSQPASALLR